MAGWSYPTIELIDKSSHYRYDLPQLPHQGFRLTQGLTPD